MKIEGTVALVTGGASGIGEMVVETLLDKGAKLVGILDIDEATGMAVAAELRKKCGNDRVMFINCDVSSKEQLQDAFTTVQSVHGRLDIVCNNAGIPETTDAEKLININLVAPINGTYLAREIMMKQSDPAGGVIVNTASIVGLIPLFIAPNYCAAKSGLIGFTRAVADDPSMRSANIRLNCICPTKVQTDLVVQTSIQLPVIGYMNSVPMTEVKKAFLLAIEDDTLNGCCIRVTHALGVDLYPQEPLMESIVKAKIYKDGKEDLHYKGV